MEKLYLAFDNNCKLLYMYIPLFARKGKRDIQMKRLEIK